MKFNKPPTAGQQLLLIDKIYKTDEELTETLTEHGYQCHKKVHVPKVSCFTYLPISFPKNKTEVQLQARITTPKGSFFRAKTSISRQSGARE